MNTQTATLAKPVEVASLDPYFLMAFLGKHVIHPGGRKATKELLRRAGLQANHQVLDAGCGVGTTAINITQQYGCQVTAVDISDLMLQRTVANVQANGVEQKVKVEKADIQALCYADGTFDRVFAEAVTMFVDRAKAARELVRVCRPGGMVLATEFLWRHPPTEEARQIILGEICPGMTFDTLDDWVKVYSRAGLKNLQICTGAFELMTLNGFLEDEGVVNSLRFMARILLNREALQKMIWLMPRMNRAVPYLGYIAISGVKPV